jgi:cytochrome P450
MSTPDVTAFDPFDNAQDIPWELFDELRAECPVARLSNGFYFFTRYDDVHEAVRDGGERIRNFAHEGGMRAPGVVVPEEEKLINELDGPRHTRRRRLLMSALQIRLIAGAEPYIRDLAARLLEPMLAAGGGDLVPEFTEPLPGMVFAHVLGLPEHDYPQFKAWSDEVLADTYPTLNRTARGEGLHGAHPEFSAYIDGIADDRRREPRDDLFTHMVESEVDGDRLTQTEIRVTVSHLIIAGHETTTNLLGNLLEHLLTTPEDLARVRADRALLAVAAEESLRRDPPVLINPTTCVVPADRHGADVPSGSRVVLSLASANRDASAYPEPDEFRLDRADAPPHVAFGGGPHVCPGASLARLEARSALDVFLDLVGEVHLASGYEREKVPVFWANGPESLPVTLARA